MRTKCLVAAAATAIMAGLALTSPAFAFGSHYTIDSAKDPYAYEYKHPGYYPYYNSGYWRPAHKVRKRRFRFVQPRYYPAWGDHRHYWLERHMKSAGPHRHHKHLY